LAAILAHKGHAVTVVDNDPEAFERLERGFTGRTLQGIGFDRGVLVEAGIERADGLASMMASDEANAVAARVAREIFKVPRVVARLYDPRKADIYKRLGLQTIQPVTWEINRIAELLCHSQLDTVATLGYGDADVMEADVPPLLAGRTVNELTLPGEIQVVALSRDGRTFLPTLGTQFRVGDLVHICVLHSSVERLRALLGQA
jgi:trk system potassium uptake protein TrkA